MCTEKLSYVNAIIMHNYIHECYHFLTFDNYYIYLSLPCIISSLSKLIWRALFKATVILLPLLGLTWVFGILTLNANATVFAWFFTLFNSLQVTLFIYIGALAFFHHKDFLKSTWPWIILAHSTSPHTVLSKLCEKGSYFHSHFHEDNFRQCIFSASVKYSNTLSSFLIPYSEKYSWGKFFADWVKIDFMG